MFWRVFDARVYKPPKTPGWITVKKTVILLMKKRKWTKEEKEAILKEIELPGLEVTLRKH